MGIGFTLLLASAGIVSLVAAMPSNILWGHTQATVLRAELNTVAGQNFAFFTRSPETEQVDAYRLGPDGTVGASLLVTPQAKAANLFGVSRTQRAQGPEMANLIHKVPPDAWADCTSLDRATCFAGILHRSQVELRNESPVPTVCGPVALTAESTVKWGYRRLIDARYTIDQIAPARVVCVHGH
ncbi:MAG TPA: SdpA family antimicrobial peptide system protein [Mycobacterium sp.]|uniref:SdpA family antimicrobial peptide system protein n=1 Tax=Mycobacterium sp. TaxID=1785 RepID=UPI002F40D295